MTTKIVEAAPASRTTTVAEALAEIQRQENALPDIGDLKSTNEAAAFHATRSALWGRRAAIQASAPVLAKIEPQLIVEQAWFDHLTAWRQTLSDELLTIISPIRDPKIKGTSDNLHLSIRVIDFGRQVIKDSTYMLSTLRLGELMRESGYTSAATIENQVVGELPWFGSLPDVKKRLTELQQQRTEAQTRLDHALLDDAGRARQAVEDADYRDAMNSLHMRNHNEYDGRVVLEAHRDDGTLLPEAEMTAVQRTAFARATRGQRAETAK